MTPVLEVRDLWAGYGDDTVLHGVDFGVDQGQVVALLGRNGAGKTTFVHTLMGMLTPRKGSIMVDGQQVVGRPTHDIARRGVAIVPQGRRVFAQLTVEDNLRIAERGSPSEAWSCARIYETLPGLARRRRSHAGQLSGGEQQMLAIARALLLKPRLMLLDEPSDGLAPAIVDQVVDVLARMREEGLSVLLVEQNLRCAFGLADDIAVMQKGRIVHRASTDDFRRDALRARDLLGV